MDDQRDGEVRVASGNPDPVIVVDPSSEPEVPGQGELVWAGFVARDGSNMAELPILIPLARGIWRSVNYTSRDHFI